ncbi:hypothetical protein MCOR27_006098 [Pyricularia oryzae]|uniref:CNH domain-containing protein n=1 Tax=Pyricularia grisea TaxID=148305 RepID=A0ABQ8NWK1_PYRGI|nr:hypothetical protein MCOR01_006999 [Pyricularia oryzae]KAI6301842.1 hypothetical protein MCOR33_002681 [Pyricularia grisea]KAI6260748.1 hypothetical protein MCOR19_002965 [Pyricularia oryzae]KAI6277220.1 hypothetical protein MCOR27_006098 [Pyricularia oryzae]KAI6279985.1 hypothetical protein MCOR26_003952 [Pyricularia oryzae]
MLSAFTARPIIELRPRDKFKIESIQTHSDRIFVGLSTGNLKIYRLTNDTNATKPTELLREVEKFSTRAIEQLAIIKEANTLVSLSNYAVSLHDLNNFRPIEAPLAKTKNATCFAVTSNVVEDPQTGIPEFISRLAVAVKRRLLLYSWHTSELSGNVEEVVLPEAIRTLTWSSATNIIVGMNAGYALVDVVTKETTEIIAGGGQGEPGSRLGAYSMGYMGLGGYMPKPLAARLGEGEMLLAKDINTVFVTSEGKVLEHKRQVPWQSAPDSIGYSYPYLIALLPPAKGSLEVRNPDTLSLLQTINLPGAAGLHFPPPNVSLAHGGKGFHISSDRCVWKMDATDYDTQVDELVKAGRYDEAISILNMLEDALLRNKIEVLREVKMLKAESLFRMKKFQQSMDLFNEEDVHAPAERVLRLFPPVIAGDLSGVPASDDGKAVEEEEVEANGSTDEHKEEKDQKQEPEPATPAKAAGGFTNRLWGLGHGLTHKKPDSDAASIASSRKPTKDDHPDDDNSSSSDKGKSSIADSGILEGKDLMDAVLELNGYLAGARARLQRVIDPTTGKLKPRNSTDPTVDSLLSGENKSESDEQLEKDLRDTFRLVDTTLFRAFMYSRPALAGSLFRIPNCCDPDVVNAKLLEQNRYNELVDFFYGKRLHRQALELLKKFGDGDAPSDVAATLHGPERTVRYLQNLPPEMIDLILEFSEWTLRANPELGMEIFLADTENAETLPRDKVVDFLAGIDVELEVRYLDHIITELNDMTPDFHNRLVDILIRHLKTKERGDQWDEMMQRLLRFLDSSRQYAVMRAYTAIKDDSAFYEAQIIVLRLMDQHREALRICVFKMEDYARAEEYCNRVHKLEPEAAEPSSSMRTVDDQEKTEPSIYHTLLSLYLDPPRQMSDPAPSPKLGPALELLSKHGSRLPASSSLSLIPDSLPISELKAYFRGQIRSANSVLNEGKVVAKLRETAMVAAQSKLLLGDDGTGGRNRRVVVSEERVCGTCHKRLGGSVVAVMPDNAVVHYGCLGRAASGSSMGSGFGGRDARGPSWGRVGGH